MNKVEIIESLNQIIEICQVNGNAYVTNKAIAIKESLVYMWDVDDFHYQKLIKSINNEDQP